MMSIREYLKTIYLPLKKLIDKKQQLINDEQKITIRIMVVFVKINNPLDRYIKYIDSDGLILRKGDDTHKFINKLFKSLLKSYDKETDALKGSNLVFDGIDLTLVQFIKIKLKRGGSYIPTLNWISVKKATINPKNTKDDYCLAYSIVACIHNNEIDHHPDRISKLKPFIKKYNWNDISFPTEQKDWDKFERTNKDIALNILSAYSTKKKINIVKTSKHNNRRKHKVILLIISDEDNNSHYICVKNLKALCRDVFLNNHGDYYCLNCLHACRTKNKLKMHEKLCLNNNYCQLKLPSVNNYKLKYKSDDKSKRTPHIIYGDLECLLKNNNDLENDLNSDNTYRFKENLHVPSGYGLYLLRSYDQNLLLIIVVLIL